MYLAKVGGMRLQRWHLILAHQILRISYPTPSYPIQFCHILSDYILSDPALAYLILALSYPIPWHPIQSCRILSEYILSHRILSDHIRLYPTLSVPNRTYHCVVSGGILISQSRRQAPIMMVFDPILSCLIRS